ncbi:hypothetical protein [Noviherbaspirillum galbum]|uniref:hypothetical protein n=1 Tax=Noviherbaspirillum galbum TaxID=2709383 RepID=UPI0013D59648|nr:hypothetical protein [Noviherbaspirillum galbum]
MKPHFFQTLFSAHSENKVFKKTAMPFFVLLIFQCRPIGPNALLHPAAGIATWVADGMHF